MKSTMEAKEPDEFSELYETPEKEKSQHDTIDEEEREQMDMTAAVPLKVLQGKHPDAPKEGDEIVVKIKSIDGDTAMIQYSETPPEEIGEHEGYENADYQSADDELEQLGQKGY